MKLLQRMKSKKGFTLVEMVLVIAILAVILAFAVPGVDSYVKRIKLMELDDSARSIFMAAQNKLMTLRSSGKSLNFEGAELVPIENVPEDFRKDDEGNLRDFADSKNPPKFTYIKSDDLKKIPEGDSNIISLGAIEDQLYSNEFVIEYDAATGTVFGVFYTEDDGALEEAYTEDTIKSIWRSGINEDGKDEFEERLKEPHLIGYYGGGTLVEVPIGDEVFMPKVTYHYSEKLVVYVLWPEEATSDKLYFTLSITGKDRFGAEHVVDIVTEDNKCFINKDSYGTIILDSLAPCGGTDEGKWDIPEVTSTDGNDFSYPFVLERDFKGWVYKEFLNQVDGTNHYVPKYDGYSDKSWCMESKYPLEISQDGGSESPYVINPGNDITVSIAFYDPAGVNESMPTVEPYDVNSYFASLEGTTAHITAGRHLQNLANYVFGKTVSDVSLDADIDFSRSRDEEAPEESWRHYNCWNAGETYANYYEFKPIGSQFVEASTFVPSFYGNNHIISYLKIDSRKHTFTDGAGVDNTAFFTNLNNGGKIYDLIFYRPWVHGETTNTAVFVGHAYNGSNFKNITIINPYVEGGLKGKDSYVGTLCGDFSGGGIDNCQVYIEAYDNNYNFTGNDMDSDDYKESLHWGDPTNDPYKKFYIKGLTATSYAGGLLGKSAGSVNTSYSAVRIESEGVAGGLIGLAENATVNNNYVGGHTHDGSYIVKTDDDTEYSLININGKVASGGFIGELRGGFSMTTDSSTASVAYSNGNGDGFIGKAPPSLDKFNNSYALGWVLEGNTVKGKESKYAVGINGISGASQIKAEPYDKSKLLGDVYPYGNDPSFTSHIGDWPVDPPLFGIFYWEKVGDEYFIKSVGYNAKEGEKVDFGELKDGVTVETFGYGYYFTNAAYKTDPNVMSDVGQSYGSVPAKIIESIENATNTQPTVFMRQWAQDGVHDLKEIIFDYSYNSNAGSKAFFFNPDFCGVSMTDNLGKRSENEPYHIRNAQQLKNINNSLGSNFVQDLDIDASGETWRPLGSFIDYFSGKYNGNNKNLTIGKLDTKKSDSGYGNGYGLFGVTRDATIERVKVDYPVDSPTAELNEYSARNGLGGIVGVAVGGTINECTVKNFNVSATKCPQIAIGGIVGFSSANITNCYVNCNGTDYDGVSKSSVAISNGGTNMNTVSAAGGIAGSASGTISGCKVYSFDMGDGKLLTDEIKNDGTFNGTLIIAGGIVGNNVSFEGKTELTVENCTSEAYLTRQRSDYGLHSYGILIHPIAPDNFKLDLKNLDLYFEDTFKSGKEMTDEEKIASYKSTLYTSGIIPNEDELPTYYFVTGTGVSDTEAEHAYNSSAFAMSVTTTITNCTAAQGRYYYNSHICGLSSGVKMEEKGQAPTPSQLENLDNINEPHDVYVFMPPNISVSYVEYTKLSPTVGVFSLFEKEGKTVIATADKIERGGSKEITSKPEGQIDPLDRYGIVTTLGRLSDLTVTVDGKPVALATGKAYLGEDGKSIELGEISGDEIDKYVKYYEFSEILLGDGLKEGSHTIVATYKNDDGSTTTYTANIHVPKRYPYAGAYRVWSAGNNLVATGVYNDADHMGDNANKIENNTDGLTDAYKYGIILEHSSLAPHTLNELSIKILYTEQGVEKTIAVKESDLNLSTSPTIGANVYGKSFDAYAVDDSVIAKMPENQDFAIEVSTVDGTLLAKLDGLKTKINIPYIGAYGVQKVQFTYEDTWTNGDQSGVTQRYAERSFIHYLAQLGNDEAIQDVNGEFTYADSGAVKQEILETTSYGVILERGYDIKKVKVKLAGGVEEAEIAGDKLVACGEIYYRADNGAQYNDPKVNNVSVSLYTIPFEMIPENTDTITVEYDGYTTYSVNVKVVDDLKCHSKHTHVWSDWQTDEEHKYHWRTCTADNCPRKDEKFDYGEHQFGNWTVKTPADENNQNGVKVRTCSVCKLSEEESYTHTFNNYGGNYWMNDEKTHWKTCSDTNCPDGQDKRLYEAAHTNTYEISGDQHKITCNICNRVWYEPHTWKTTETDDKFIYTCEACGATKEEQKRPPEDIKYVGIYVRATDQWNNKIYKTWFTNDGGTIDVSDNNNCILIGEAGILINKTFINDITVYVDETPIVSNTLAVDDMDNGILSHFNDKNQLRLTAYRIPSSMLKNEVVTITVKANDGKTLISQDKIRVREHTHVAEWQPPTGDQDTKYHYGKCTAEFCPLPEGELANEPHHVAEDAVQDKPGVIKYICDICGYSWEEVPPPDVALILFNPNDTSQYYIKYTDGSSRKIAGAPNASCTSVYFAIDSSRIDDIDNIKLKQDHSQIINTTKPDSIIFEMPSELSKFTIVWNVGGGVV